MPRASISDLAGAGPLGFFLCASIFLACRASERAIGVAPLPGSRWLHLVLAGLLLLGAGSVFFVAVRAMPLGKHSKVLITHGVYSHVRHPRYSAFVFLVYPACSLLTQSTLCTVSTVLAYVAFKAASLLEEQKLIRLFGQAYRDYMKDTPGFVPRLRRR